MKIFVLGSSGMLGSYVTSFFRKAYRATNVEVMPVVRAVFDIAREVRKDPDFLVLGIQPGDVVVNCAGIINKRDDLPSGDLLRESILVNSIFPRLMAQVCIKRSAKFIHISTDCVFDGSKGNYGSDDPHTSTDIYGITKSCGEPSPDECILIRTSIIGESQNGRSLVEWLRSQKGKTIVGYDNHLWNGVTCLELAKRIFDILALNRYTGLFVIVSPGVVTKYELCKKIADAYRWNITITRGAGAKDINRTLRGNLVCNPIDQQIEEMVAYSS